MRERRYIFISIAVIAAIVLLNLSGAVSRHAKTAFREAVAPFDNFFSGSAARLKESFGVLTASPDSRKAGRQADEELFRLRQLPNEIAALQRENTALREQLGFARRITMNLILGEVVSRGDASGWWEIVGLDKGAEDGVSEDMAVMTPEGLVGKTVTAAKHTCDVLLITDRNCNVSARTTRGGNFGIVRGLGGSSSAAGGGSAPLCVMEQLSAQADVKEGDEVVTCGLGGVFPKGLKVGTVVAVATDKTGMHKTAVVKPAADLSRIEYVFVVASRAESGSDRRENGKAR